jgi:hypothetical protein
MAKHLFTDRTNNVDQVRKNTMKDSLLLRGYILHLSSCELCRYCSPTPTTLHRFMTGSRLLQVQVNFPNSLRITCGMRFLSSAAQIDDGLCVCADASIAFEVGDQNECPLTPSLGGAFNIHGKGAKNVTVSPSAAFNGPTPNNTPTSASVPQPAPVLLSMAINELQQVSPIEIYMFCHKMLSCTNRQAHTSSTLGRSRQNESRVYLHPSSFVWCKSIHTRHFTISRRDLTKYCIF